MEYILCFSCSSSSFPYMLPPYTNHTTRAKTPLDVTDLEVPSKHLFVSLWRETMSFLPHLPRYEPYPQYANINAQPRRSIRHVIPGPRCNGDSERYRKSFAEPVLSKILRPDKSGLRMTESEGIGLTDRR